MLFLDHSSPRADMMPDTWFLENSQFFSPTASHSYSSPVHTHTHTHSQFQSPSHCQSPIQRKRRLSLEASAEKRSRGVTHDRRTPVGLDNQGWPTFELPGGGGKVEQSPYGMIKRIQEDKVETSTIDKSITLKSFQERPQTPRKPYIVVTPSPTQEVECYMAEGYRQVNHSYHVHEEVIANANYSLYDHSNEDAHIDSDVEM